MPEKRTDEPGLTGSQPADLWWKAGSAAVQLPFQLVLLQNKLSSWALKKEQEASYASWIPPPWGWECITQYQKRWYAV